MIKSFAHDAVDAVQKTKLQFISTFVKHEGLAETLTKYIQAQTEYTKSALNTNIDAITDFGLAITNKDFAKEIISAYGFDKFVPTVTGKTVKAASKKAQ